MKMNYTKKIMKYLIDKDMSFQEYVMELIAQDMNNHKMPHKDKKEIARMKSTSNSYKSECDYAELCG